MKWTWKRVSWIRIPAVKFYGEIPDADDSVYDMDYILGFFHLIWTAMLM